MEIQISQTSKNFLLAIQEDLPTVKLFKYRHYLSTYKNVAMQLFNQMCDYALQKKQLGQYQAIFQTIKKDIERTQKYKIQRQAMIDWTNPVRNQTQHAESISSLQDMVKGYYKLAQYYRSIAMHKQAINYYNKLFRTQTGSKVIYQRSQYFSAWAQQLYFDNDLNGLNIFVRNDVQDPKLVDSTLATIKDLKYIDLNKSALKFFQNLLSGNYNLTVILNNQVISYLDLGFIYSLIALAKKQRQFLKIKTPWSSKLQVLYLQNNFKQLLQKIHQTYQTQGKFNPFIDKIYNHHMEIIRQRILKKYLQIYNSVPLVQLQNQTGFNQGALKIFLQQNTQLPYLIDPITQSVIYHEKSLPLYDETLQFSYLVKEKFREVIKNCIMAKRNEVGDLGSRFGGKGIRSMFGGMMDMDDF